MDRGFSRRVTPCSMVHFTEVIEGPVAAMFRVEGQPSGSMQEAHHTAQASTAWTHILESCIVRT